MARERSRSRLRALRMLLAEDYREDVLLVPGAIFVEVAMTSGRTIMVQVRVSDTIESLKIMIQHRWDIPPAQQVLSFGGRELQDHHSVMYYDIFEGSTLNLGFTFPTQQIFVRTQQAVMIPLDVWLNDSIDSVKFQIQDIVHIPADQQRLRFNGVLLQDGSDLYEYSIQEESTLHLEVAGSVSVMTPAGREITLSLFGSDTVDNIKRMIQEKKGMSANHWRLIFDGRELVGGLLSDYLIFEKSVLHVELRARGGTE